MDQRRFDNLCRGLATGASRRGVLKAIGGGITGAFLATAAAPVGAAYDRHREDGSLNCGKGKHRDDNGACVCKPLSCGPYLHQDPDTCQCVSNMCLPLEAPCNLNGGPPCCIGTCFGLGDPICLLT